MERKIRLQAIKPVDDVVDILIIDGRDFVLIVVLEDQQNFVNQAGEIDTDLLMDKNLSIVNFEISYFFIITL